ncbi:response regulator [Halobaculum sp. EA56]|uniref:sensor histidine kinase n=1 Tax=Halobaculum sp. EA56 TaxID=3421648 RepID=UPI003EBC1F9F
MTARPVHVLCVDDEPGFRDLLARVLTEELDDVTVSTAAAAAEAEAIVADAEPSVDCVVSDYDMPDRDGLDLLRSVRDAEPDLPFLLFTGKGDEAVASEAISAGVTDYVRKGDADATTLLANRVREAVEKYRTEETLRAERRLFGTVLETNPNGVLLVDVTDDGIVYANERARELLRLDPEGESARYPSSTADARPYPDPDWEIVDLDGRYADDELAYRTAVSTGEPVYDVHHAIEFPDGTRRLIVVDAAPVHANGDPRFVVVTVADVTESEHRRAEAERYELLVENATDAMAVLEDGRYRLVNGACADLLGRPRGEILGASDREVLPDGVADEVRERSDRAIEEGSHRRHRVEMDAEDGVRSFEVVHVPHGGGPGDAGGVVRVWQDVTDLAERERLLREERDRLESLASTVAHDARNAIQLIDGRADLAREALPDGAERSRRHLDSVASGVDRLHELVVSLESLRGVNDPVTDPEPVAVGDAAEAAWSTVDADGADLRVEANPVVEGDPKRVRTLLENLLRNAVEHGGRDVTAVVDDLPADHGFAVADDGAGIPEDDRERVLEFGFSAGGGTGLGLGIVAGIADAHGWDVTVTESSEGGARFEFRPETIDSFVS